MANRGCADLVASVQGPLGGQAEPFVTPVSARDEPGESGPEANQQTGQSHDWLGARGGPVRRAYQSSTAATSATRGAANCPGQPLRPAKSGRHRTMKQRIECGLQLFRFRPICGRVGVLRGQADRAVTGKLLWAAAVVCSSRIDLPHVGPIAMALPVSVLTVTQLTFITETHRSDAFVRQVPRKYPRPPGPFCRSSFDAGMLFRLG